MPVTQDGQEAGSSKRVEVEEEAEMSETEEMSDDSEYQPSSDVEESDSGTEDSSSESEDGSEFETKRQIDILKRKRKAQLEKQAKKQKIDVKKVVFKPESAKPTKPTQKPIVKPQKPAKKVVSKEKKKPEPENQKSVEKTSEKDDKTPMEGEETEHGKVDNEEDGKKSKKREPPVFNDKNVDYNLFNDAPENVMARKIKISNTVLVTCKMIDAITGGANAGLSYDYAALTFMRKIQNQKAFEFNLPLSLTPNIIEALKLIMKDNPKFFKKHMPAYSAD